MQIDSNISPNKNSAYVGGVFIFEKIPSLVEYFARCYTMIYTE